MLRDLSQTHPAKQEVEQVNKHHQRSRSDAPPDKGHYDGHLEQGAKGGIGCVWEDHTARRYQVIAMDI